MSDKQEERPDHTLANAKIDKTNEPPKVYAVTNLKAYLKPDMDEELAAPMGAPAACGTEVSCACVPVETCACNTVAYHVGGSFCPTDCTCQATGGCVGLYWYPS